MLLSLIVIIAVAIFIFICRGLIQAEGLMHVPAFKAVPAVPPGTMAVEVMVEEMVVVRRRRSETRGRKMSYRGMGNENTWDQEASDS